MRLISGKVPATLKDLMGALRRKGDPVRSLDQIDEAISSFVAEDQERIRSSKAPATSRTI